MKRTNQVVAMALAAALAGCAAPGVMPGNDAPARTQQSVQAPAPASVGQQVVEGLSGLFRCLGDVATCQAKGQGASAAAEFRSRAAGELARVQATAAQLKAGKSKVDVQILTRAIPLSVAGAAQAPVATFGTMTVLVPEKAERDAVARLKELAIVLADGRSSTVEFSIMERGATDTSDQAGQDKRTPTGQGVVKFSLMQSPTVARGMAKIVIRSINNPPILRF